MSEHENEMSVLSAKSLFYVRVVLKKEILMSLLMFIAYILKMILSLKLQNTNLFAKDTTKSSIWILMRLLVKFIVQPVTLFCCTGILKNTLRMI